MKPDAPGVASAAGPASLISERQELPLLSAGPLRERQRLLRPQPPPPVPQRAQPTPQTGLLAHGLLGHQVVK